MNIFKVLLSIAILFFIVWRCSFQQASNDVCLQDVKNNIIASNERFRQKIQSLQNSIQEKLQETDIRQTFDSVRAEYKNIEWAVAYFMPETARFTNGPALDEIELEEHVVLEAEGLQVLEELIYPQVDTSQYEEMLRMTKKLLNKTQSIESYFHANTISSAQLMDALRMQVFRVTTLGITGFDTPISGNGLKESAYALKGIIGVLDRLRNSVKKKEAVDKVITQINDAIAVLSQPLHKNDFNYIDFITNHLNVISKGLHDLRLVENIAAVEVTKAIDDNAATLFVQSAFHPDAFVPGIEYKTSSEKASLGKMLFSNPILSGDGKRSCVSCHSPNLAFTDGVKTATTIGGTNLLRNTPSLNYSNYQHGQFWDMRRPDLETQAEDVITNKDELHGSLKNILAKLNVDDVYKNKFKSIYKTDTIVAWQLQNVLASYIRSLSTFTSAFDRCMRGEKQALNAIQKKGFNLFVGKGKCATCHFIPLFNGTVPPEFSKTESEVLGIAINFTNKKLDDDPGRGRFHETVPQLQRSFKTPTLRNIAKTAPYMHNGGYNTLQQVMDFYNKGGGQGVGFQVDNQTLPAEKLNLSQEEINTIIEFMNTLSDAPY